MNGRFPRSCLEAWPTHYPHSIQRFRQPLAERVADWLLAIVIGMVLAVCLVIGASA